MLRNTPLYDVFAQIRLLCLSWRPLKIVCLGESALSHHFGAAIHRENAISPRLPAQINIRRRILSRAARGLHSSPRRCSGSARRLSRSVSVRSPAPQASVAKHRRIETADDDDDDDEAEAEEDDEDEDLDAEDDDDALTQENHAFRKFDNFANDFSSSFMPNFHPTFGLAPTNSLGFGQQFMFFENPQSHQSEFKLDFPLRFFGEAMCPRANVDPREIYCLVPGRTSLLSATTKYKVTVGEIQRRISAPECLNASLLGGILRKAKSKDGGKTLRDSLKKIGLTLPAGRRKQAIVTAWTALVEEEAVHMAKDFHAVCEKEFRAKEFGLYLTKIGIAREGGSLKRREALEATRRIVDEMMELVASDRTPLTAPTAFAPRSTMFLDPAIQQHLTHFAMVTHGFGALAVRAVLGCVRRVVDESLAFLDLNFNSAMYPMQQFSR